MYRRRRRTMLFSATYTPADPGSCREDAAGSRNTSRRHPSHTAAESVVQKVHLVDRSNKRALLVHLITVRKLESDTGLHPHPARGQHAHGKTRRTWDQGCRDAWETRASLSGHDPSKAFKERRDPHTRGNGMWPQGAWTSAICPMWSIMTCRAAPRIMFTASDAPAERVKAASPCPWSVPKNGLHLQAIEKLLKRKIPVEKVDGFTEGCDVPDYVPLSSRQCIKRKKWSDNDIKEIVARRTASKKQSKTRNAKKTGSRQKVRRLGRHPDPAGKTKRPGKSRPNQGPRRPQPSRPGKPTGRKIRRFQKIKPERKDR